MRYTHETQKPLPVLPETVQGWMAAEKPGKSIAVYGGSIELVQAIISSGFIPGYPQEEVTLAYQKHIVSGGEILYYVLPFVGRVEKSHPRYFKRLRGAHGGVTPVWLRRHYSLDYTLDLAWGYAWRKAVKDAFRAATGLKVDDTDAILAVAQEEIPDQFASAFADPILSEELEDLRSFFPGVVGSEEYRLVRRAIGRYGLSVLSACLRRRGVLLYFNEGISFGTEYIPGIEDESELIITSRHPLPATVIAGIEVRTAEEKAMISR